MICMICGKTTNIHHPPGVIYWFYTFYRYGATRHDATRRDGQDTTAVSLAFVLSTLSFKVEKRIHNLLIDVHALLNMFAIDITVSDNLFANRTMIQICELLENRHVVNNHTRTVVLRLQDDPSRARQKKKREISPRSFYKERNIFINVIRCCYFRKHRTASKAPLNTVESQHCGHRRP